MAVASYTALIGTSDPIEAHDNLDELARCLPSRRSPCAPARFDVDELKGLNARLLHKLPYEAVAERLKALGIEGGPEFWAAVRGNLSVLEDAQAVVAHRLRRGAASERGSGADRARRGLLPEEPWDDTTWDVWIGALKAATGRKGRASFPSLAPGADRARGWPRAEGCCCRSSAAQEPQAGCSAAARAESSRRASARRAGRRTRPCA